MNHNMTMIEDIIMRKWVYDTQRKDVDGCKTGFVLVSKYDC